MSYMIEIPVEDGSALFVEASEGDLPGDLALAARPGEIATRAQASLEEALESVRPALAALRERLESVAPQEIELEFGMKLGAEAGVVIAKGTTEVHFRVTLTWKPQGG